MPVDLESCEQEFENEQCAYRRERDRRVLPHDRPPRERPRSRPPFPRWKLAAVPDDFNRFWRKRPCPYPLTPNPRALADLTSWCEGHTELLQRRHVARFRPALLAVSAHRRDWLRPLPSWDPPGGGPGRQFQSLVRHLFALYDVPRFLDAAWLEGLTPDGVTYQGWYTHVGRGRNIRTARGLPVPLTKRMAHLFLRAPDDLSIPEAFRFTRVLSQGGDERLARSLLGTRIGTRFLGDPFWDSVARWFAAHPDLDAVHHGPVVDYLHDQKYVPTLNPASRVRGQPRQPLLVPPRSNLSMTGRTPEAMLRAVERWHRDLRSSLPLTLTEWTPSPVAPLVLEEGKGEDRRVYETTELICTEELQEEGRAMGHCVASYWGLCASGQSSIWSLTVEDAAGRTVRLLTLQVREGRRIVQARGVGNRLPTGEELRVLARWADSGGPSLSPFLGKPPVGD